MTEAEQVMKRCQIGTRNYEEANNLHADCYRVIGKLLAEHAMREVQRLGQEIEQEPVAVYGYCPECGATGVMRERRPNGNDKCANGHTYPSSTSTPPQRTEQEPEEHRLLRRKWFGHRDTGHLSFIEAVDVTMEKIYSQPKQEPVADDIASIIAARDMLDAQPVPPRTWVGLTDEQANEYNYLGPDMPWVVREVAAILKEQNT